MARDPSKPPGANQPLTFTHQREAVATFRLAAAPVPELSPQFLQVRSFEGTFSKLLIYADFGEEYHL